MRVLSVVHDPAVTGGGGLFENVVVQRGDHLDRWVVANGDAAPGDPAHWDAVMVFGGAMHPTRTPSTRGFGARSPSSSRPSIRASRRSASASVRS